MRTRYWPLALALGLALGALLAAPAADEAAKADAERIAKLVKQLGSDSFEDRENASKELEKIGPAALDALREAAKAGEAEVKTRAEDLIQKAEKKVAADKNKAAAEKLLVPTRVKLVFKDTPLADALAEFNKKSGYTVQLHDPEKKLKDRTVTLDTGEVAFWEAFDKFCAKAGLVEATFRDLMPRPGLPGGGLVPPGGGFAPPKPSAPAEKKEPPARAPEKKEDGDKEAPALVPGKAPVPPAGGAGGPPVARPGPGGFGPFGMEPGVIMVVDGKPKAVPTCYAGAVRVRALKEGPNVGFAVPLLPPGGGPAAPPGGFPGGKEDTTIVWLEVRAEPKLQLQFLQSVAVDKATDDRDQKLEQARPAAPALPGLPGGGAPGLNPAPATRPALAPIGIGGGGFGGFGVIGGGFGGAQTYPVMLKKGEKEGKALKEFAGKITAQALTAAEPVITAEKITKAAGETFKGKEGGRIKVTEVKEDDGTITVKFEMELPDNVVPAGGGFGPIGIAMPPGGLVPPPPAPPPPPPGGAGLAFQVQAPGGDPPPPLPPGGGPGFGPPGFRGFVPAPGITLVDEKGKTIAQTGGGFPRYRIGGPGKPVVLECTQEYKLAKDQKPAKLVFSGSKVVTIDIPFALKDVPLR